MNKLSKARMKMIGASHHFLRILRYAQNSEAMENFDIMFLRFFMAQAVEGS